MSQTLNYADIAVGDLVKFYDSSAGTWRVTTVTQLHELLESLTETTYFNEFSTQYSIPLAGSNVQVDDTDANTHLIVTPAATLATLTITLPSSTVAQDKQELVVSTTNELTALTIGANGASGVYGAPTTLLAGGYFRMKYDALSQSWFRIG